MIIDKNLLVSNAQAITTTAVSTDVVDLGKAMDYGIGEPALKTYVQVVEAFTSGGAGTLQIVLQGSADNSTWYDMLSSQTYALADLTLGAQLFAVSMPRPPAGEPLPRYHRFNYVNGTAAMTAGKVTAGFTLDRQDNQPPNYPAGITISN